MTPMIPSNRDLEFDGNLTQARYELHKAIDRGGEAEQAAWTRNWGEAALTRAEGVSPDWDESGPSERLIQAASRATEIAANLHAALHRDAPVMSTAKEHLSSLRRQLLTINECLDAEDQ
ncbi:hypothetical protein [Brevundimonas nasdae]|uniref:Uncharacterized protein n=1 Tax=Brevundimonas nasdae TaxID=172043 RepID=A0ACD4VLB6_9CAUL|nr:hypothetical protein [Brevundimonas nasdae]WOB78313.1 hypothetical protein PZA08_13535 [Brevundimonas nasdae]